MLKQHILLYTQKSSDYESNFVTISQTTFGFAF